MILIQKSSPTRGEATECPIAHREPFCPASDPSPPEWKWRCNPGPCARSSPGAWRERSFAADKLRERVRWPPCAGQIVRHVEFDAAEFERDGNGGLLARDLSNRPEHAGERMCCTGFSKPETCVFTRMFSHIICCGTCCFIAGRRFGETPALILLLTQLVPQRQLLFRARSVSTRAIAS